MRLNTAYRLRGVGNFLSKEMRSTKNACAPVNPETGPGDLSLWKRLNNLETFTEKHLENSGVDWTKRMELVRESVVQLIAANDTYRLNAIIRQ